MIPLTLTMALVSGCMTVGPEYETPDVAVPDAWYVAATDGLASGEASLQTWWSLLDDPKLVELTERAAAANLDLRTALWRVEEARALRGVAAGTRAPQVAASASAVRQQGSDNGPLGALAPDGLEPGNQFDVGVGASWEIDLFGGIRRAVEAADATVEASTEAWRDVLVAVTAETALAYVDLCTTGERLRLARANVEAQQRTLKLTRDRFDAGLVSGLDIAQAESILASTEALIPLLETSREAALNRLAVLLGGAPGSLHDELSSPEAVPEEPEVVAVGLPIELLRQRPDVRRAERELAAQTARIGVATAELYPSFSLSGALGLQALEAGDLGSGDSLTWSVGLPIRWSIFSGGRIRSQIRAEEARSQQLLAQYEQTVLKALEEAENAMVTYERQRRRRAQLEQSVDATERAFDLVMTQYRSGLTNFQNVLDTQRSLLTRQDELAATRGDVVRGLVALYRALGGGWDPVLEPVAPEAAGRSAAVAAEEDAT